jgi:SsrA-binding protein
MPAVRVPHTSKLLIEHRKARFEYAWESEVVAGVALTGAEVKMLRHKHGSLTGSFVKVVQNQLVLLGAQIPPYPPAADPDYDPLRTRRLLVHQRELQHLIMATKKKGITLVPVAIELQGKFIKVRIAIAHGKKQFEKRRDVQKRDMERALKREFKGRVHV